MSEVNSFFSLHHNVVTSWSIKTHSHHHSWNIIKLDAYCQSLCQKNWVLRKKFCPIYRYQSIYVEILDSDCFIWYKNDASLDEWLRSHRLANVYWSFFMKMSPPEPQRMLPNLLTVLHAIKCLDLKRP